jgi:hypothetical protein
MFSRLKFGSRIFRVTSVTESPRGTVAPMSTNKTTTASFRPPALRAAAVVNAPFRSSGPRLRDREQLATAVR